ncbi:MAG: hypothetical protein CVV44_08595 [Spirochaetae bacterium HGW-Spirochaetae-1]|jgi:hypothetical protein|nr:MAG: hypothetical protein CVV44_08595 [Spirochaetae bacterium HGW-Spirochaetae-1]
MTEEQTGKAIPVLSIITAAGLILFWIGFFTVGLAPENPPQCYFAYEHSFPLPDIILAIVMLAGGILNLKGIPLGTTLLVAGGGALAFLGVLDFSFNIQNGMYLISTMDLVLNAFINLWSVCFGIALVVKLK